MSETFFYMTTVIPLFMPVFLWYVFVIPPTKKLSEEFNQRMRPWRIVMNTYTALALVAFSIMLYFHFK